MINHVFPGIYFCAFSQVNIFVFLGYEYFEFLDTGPNRPLDSPQAMVLQSFGEGPKQFTFIQAISVGVVAGVTSPNASRSGRAGQVLCRSAAPLWRKIAFHRFVAQHTKAKMKFRVFLAAAALGVCDNRRFACQLEHIDALRGSAEGRNQKC